MLQECGPWSTLVEIVRYTRPVLDQSIGPIGSCWMQSSLMHHDEAVSVLSVVRRVMTVRMMSGAGDFGDDGDLCNVHRDDR